MTATASSSMSPLVRFFALLPILLILPLDDLSNSACEKVAHNVKGTKAIPHAYGRLQFGEDLELFFRTLIGTGANPNVAAVVVIGIEPEWTHRIVEGIAKTGKPVSGFSIERFGEFKTVEMACWKAKEYVHWASELRREEVSLKEIWVSVKCGETFVSWLSFVTSMKPVPAIGSPP